MFAGLIVLPAMGWRLRKLNAVFAFWFAYVLTRPLGASFADWFGKRRTLSGLGYGDGRVALIGDSRDRGAGRLSGSRPQ